MPNSDREPEQVSRSTVDDTLPFVAVGVLLLRRIGLIIGIAAVSAAVAVVILIIQDRRYTADTSFVPSGRRTRGEISGIAAQLGLSVPSADASESPLFFIDLARTRPVLAAVAESASGVLHGKTLEDLFDVSQGSVQRRRAKAIRALNRALGTNVSTKTSIVELTLSTPDSSASAALLALLVRTLDRFNGASHRTQAGAQRRFTEERVNATQLELRRAEDRLRDFLVRNRVAGSPQLSLEEDRLRRDILSAQSLYTALQEAMEQARLEELRDTPVITVLEAPVAPLDPDPRHLGRYAFVAGTFGALIATLFILISGVGTVRELTDAEARLEFRRAIRAPWSRIRET